MTDDRLGKVLDEMRTIFLSDPVKAVKGQGFISKLHGYIAEELEARLTPKAKKDGVQVVQEATVFGSHKPKDVDVSVIHPHNGPLLMVGVRSQMSSTGSNALGYYEGIIGECIGLQDRFPMATIGYVYLMPLEIIHQKGHDKSKKPKEETITHARWAKLYAAITGRGGHDYKSLRGIYDQFAYMVVDFSKSPPTIEDAIVKAAVPKTDLSVRTFVDRMIQTYIDRNLFLDYFK